MFKKKRAASAASPAVRAAAPASSAASTAALQAFNASRGSTTSLSSAAAAAALRSYPTSPTPVGDIQTKRMVKRASSQSSNGSASRASLSRQSSSASMGDRTFREPSPGRPSPQHHADNAPPMPPLPAAMPSSSKSKAKKKVEASASPVPAPESPDQDRRSSADRQDGKRSSINFSRPMSPPLSPPASPPPPSRPRVSSLSAADQAAVEHRVTDAATAPVKKKKKKAPQIAEGSHLAAGTAGGKPTGMAVGEQSKQKKNKAVILPEEKSDPTQREPIQTEPYQTQSLRASGMLTKQPSVVREDREGEEREAMAVNGHAAHPPEVNGKLAPIDTIHVVRRDSNSPSRSARFSAQPIQPANGRLHEPLGRSVSPGKSAMKRTPSPRGPSPSDPNWNRPGFTPSEASDVPSHASEETRKKKKGVRVSFDVEPVVVGQAADQVNTSPVVASPQNERQRKGWFSFGKDKAKPSAIEEEDDFMKPRPALPSFGSIRGRPDIKNDSRDDLVHAISSDHAIGGLLQQAKDSNEPLPPEVTSIEGSGYYSDSEESVPDILSGPELKQEVAPEPAFEPEVVLQSVEEHPAETLVEDESATYLHTGEPVVRISKAGRSKPKDVQIPKISVQPSTPGIDAEAQRDSFLYMPGGFPSSETLRRTDSQSSTNERVDRTPLTTEPLNATAVITSADASEDESDDSGNSVYSDAASETSDFEGDGFGSINAIMDSPLPESKVQKSAEARPPTPPVSHKDARTPTSPASSHILEAQLRAANEQSDSKESIPTKRVTKPMMKETAKEVKPATVAKKVVKDKPATTVQETKTPPATAKAPANSQPQPASKPTKSALKPTRQSSVSPSPHRFRSSMRDSRIQPRMENEPRRPKTPLKTASDDIPLDARQLLAKKKRPTSIASDSPPIGNGGPRVRSGSRPVSMSGLDLPPSAAPPVPKLPTGDDSDSDSSFKRMRSRPSTSDGSRVSMRRSMRAAPMHANLRGPSSMRSSMRASEPERTQSPPPPRKFFSMSKKEKEPKALSPAPPARRLRTRPTAGSDSEDDAGPRRFKSRFVDSSDEEELTPVRGIPRADDADSTDLEGEGESVKSPGASKAKLSLAIPNGSATAAAKAGEGSALANKTMREPEPGRAAVSVPSSPKRDQSEKRRSLFGNLGRRKDKGSKVGKLDLESAARRDTPLERSRADRVATAPTTAATARSPADSAPPLARSPKLLKRRTSSYTGTSPAHEVWPTPPPIPEEPLGQRAILSRPATSDGSTPTTKAERPSLGSRVLSGTAVPTATELMGKGKKKRFGALRKAFGIKDKA